MIVKTTRSAGLAQALAGRAAVHRGEGWARIERMYGSLLEARDADTKIKPRVVICARIYAKCEHVYWIDTASLMLLSENWIPLEGREIDLIQALTEQKRRFLKPLRYDARSVAAFPNVLLLDTVAKPIPLHVLSVTMTAQGRAVKEKAAKAPGETTWMWSTDKPIPPLPQAVPSHCLESGHLGSSFGM